MSQSSWVAAGVGAAAFVVALGGMTLGVRSTVRAAGERMVLPEKENKPAIAIADHAEEKYCTPRFKEVLERVLHSCGLIQGGEARGCKPADVKSFASISDSDFNELFSPLKQRGAVLMFDTGKDDLDDAAKNMLDDRWTDRKGARYFFVVARASKTGTSAKNRALSHRRANSVLYRVKETSKEPEIDKMVGLLWLGDEFAQLPKEFCDWQHSRGEKKCDDESINRSAFVSWVNCRL